MIHKQFFQTSTPHLFAHRGGNLAGAENTIAAFSSAVDHGCRYLETDVLLTNDDKVVTYHGSRTKQEAEKTQLLTRKEVKTLTHEDVCSRLNMEVPLLEEVLRKLPKTRFSIDVKTDEVVRPTIEVVRRTDSVDRICIASFSLRRLLRAANLLGGAEQIALAYCVHPRLRGFVRAFPEIFLRGLARKSVDCIHIHHKTVTSRIVNAAHKQGIIVYAWTVNTKEELERCLDLGVDGIISDETKLLSIRKM